MQNRYEGPELKLFPEHIDTFRYPDVSLPDKPKYFKEDIQALIKHTWACKGKVTFYTDGHGMYQAVTPDKEEIEIFI